MTKISIIAAIGPYRELGKDNKLLWHISEDLKRFKKLTEGRAVIMGRKTYESLGKPLPNRLNIVITRNKHLKQTHFDVLKHCSKKVFFCGSLDKAIKTAKDLISKISDLGPDEIFIIGGGQIYAQALPLADKLYLTVVEKTPDHPDGKFDADTFFPEYKYHFKKTIYQKKRERNGCNYQFLELEK